MANKRIPSCDVEQTRAQIEELIEDWRDSSGPLPVWGRVIAREAGVGADTVSDAATDRFARRWLAKELTNQVDYGSSSQVCGYGYVWHKYTGEGRRFRRRLDRGK